MRQRLKPSVGDIPSPEQPKYNKCPNRAILKIYVLPYIKNRGMESEQTELVLQSFEEAMKKEDITHLLINPTLAEDLIIHSGGLEKRLEEYRKIIDDILHGKRDINKNNEIELILSYTLTKGAVVSHSDTRSLDYATFRKRILEARELPPTPKELKETEPFIISEITYKEAPINVGTIKLYHEELKILLNRSNGSWREALFGMLKDKQNGLKPYYESQIKPMIDKLLSESSLTLVDDMFLNDETVLSLIKKLSGNIAIWFYKSRHNTHMKHTLETLVFTIILKERISMSDKSLINSYSDSSPPGERHKMMSLLLNIYTDTYPDLIKELINSQDPDSDLIKPAVWGNNKSLYQDRKAIKNVKKEFGKVKTEHIKDIKATLVPAKQKIDRNYSSISHDCLGENEGAIYEEDFLLYRILLENSQRIDGYIYVAERTVKGEKIWILPGIQPSPSVDIDYDAFLEGALNVLEDEARKRNVKRIFLPGDASYQSNREGMKNAIERAAFESITLPQSISFPRKGSPSFDLDTFLLARIVRNLSIKYNGLGNVPEVILKQRNLTLQSISQGWYEATWSGGINFQLTLGLNQSQRQKVLAAISGTRKILADYRVKTGFRSVCQMHTLLLLHILSLMEIPVRRIYFKGHYAVELTDTGYVADAFPSTSSLYMYRPKKSSLNLKKKPGLIVKPGSQAHKKYYSLFEPKPVTETNTKPKFRINLQEILSLYNSEIERITKGEVFYIDGVAECKRDEGLHLSESTILGEFCRQWTELGGKVSFTKLDIRDEALETLNVKNAMGIGALAIGLDDKVKISLQGPRWLVEHYGEEVLAKIKQMFVRQLAEDYIVKLPSNKQKRPGPFPARTRGITSIPVLLASCLPVLLAYPETLALLGILAVGVAAGVVNGKGDFDSGYSLMRKAFSSKISNFLSNFSGVILERRSFRALIIVAGLGGWILMRIIPEYFCGGYINISAKCWSWVTIILLLSCATWAIFLSSEPRGRTKTSCFSAFRKFSTSLRTFSSIRNRILGYFDKRNVFARFNYFRSIMQGCLNVLFGKLRVSILNNFFRCLTSLKHFKNKINHYARAFKTSLTMAYVRICRDIVSIIRHFGYLLYLYLKYTISCPKSQSFPTPNPKAAKARNRGIVYPPVLLASCLPVLGLLGRNNEQEVFTAGLLSPPMLILLALAVAAYLCQRLNLGQKLFRPGLNRIRKKIVIMVLMVSIFLSTLPGCTYPSYQHIKAIQATPYTMTDKTIPRLIDILQHNLMWEWRRTAAKKLGELGDESVVPVLVEAFRKNKKAEIRCAIVESLEALGDKRAISILTEVAAKNESPKLRYAAIKALFAISGEEATAVFKGALQDDDSNVRLIAAGSLWKFGDNSVIQVVIDVLKSAKDRDIRVTAVEMLGEFGSKIAVPALTKALDDEDTYIRAAAAQALLDINKLKESNSQPKQKTRSKGIIYTPFLLGMCLPVLAVLGVNNDPEALVAANLSPPISILIAILAVGFLGYYILKYLRKHFRKSIIIAMIVAITISTFFSAGCDSGLTHTDTVFMGYAGVKKHMILGDACLSRGDRKCAEEHYSKIVLMCSRGLESPPCYAETYLSRGDAYVRLGKYEQAMADYDKGIRINSFNERAGFGLGKALHTTYYALPYYNRALLHHRLGEYAKAISDYSEVLKRKPKFSIGYYNRAIAFEILGLEKDAIADYTKVFEANLDYGPMLATTIAALRRCGNESGFEASIAGLESKNKNIRLASAYALGRLGDSAAIPGLVQRLDDKNTDVRGTAMNALRLIDTDDRDTIVSATIKGLKDKDERVRILAARIIAEKKLYAKEAVPGLLKLFAKGSDDARQFAAEILFTTKLVNEVSVSVLEKAHKDEILNIRIAGIWGWGNLKHELAVSKLIDSLGDDELRVRGAVLIALGKKEDARAKEMLIKFSEGKDKFMREYAIGSLWNVEDEVAIKILLPATDDKEGTVRQAAIKSLIYRFENNPQLIDAFIHIAQKTDENTLTRQIAIEVLGERPEPEALNCLIQCAKDENASVRGVAVLSLEGKIVDNPQALEALKLTLDDEDTGVRRAAITVLSEHLKEFPELVVLLSEKLTDDEPLICRTAALSLAKYVGDFPELKEPIEQVLRKGELETRQALVLNLRESDSPEALELLKTAYQDNYWPIRQTAVLSAAEIDLPEVPDFIANAAADNAWQVQQAVAFVANNFPDPQITQAVMPLLESTHHLVRQAAAGTLAPRIDISPELIGPVNRIINSDPNPFVRQTAILSLPTEFKQPQLLESVKGNLSSNNWRESSSAALALSSQINHHPEVLNSVKPLLESNHWQDRQAAVQTIAISNYPQVPDLLSAQLNDPSWQVRHTTINSLGNRLNDFPQLQNRIKPFLNDSHHLVRQAATMSLGNQLNNNPQLVKPFVNAAQHDADFWTRQIAAVSLQALENPPPQMKNIEPVIHQSILDVKAVVFIPGVDDRLGFRSRTGRDLNVDSSKDLRLRKVFESGGIPFIEHRWPGNRDDIASAQLSLDATMTKALDIAGPEGKVMTIMYSGGNWVGERFGAPNLEPMVRQAFNENRIDLLSLASPSRYDFSKIDSDWKNIGSPFDPAYRLSEMITPNRYDIQYSYFPNIVLNPHDIHKDPRVIYSITHLAIPQSHSMNFTNIAPPTPYLDQLEQKYSVLGKHPMSIDAYNSLVETNRWHNQIRSRNITTFDPRYMSTSPPGFEHNVLDSTSRWRLEVYRQNITTFDPRYMSTPPPGSVYIPSSVTGGAPYTGGP